MFKFFRFILEALRDGFREGWFGNLDPHYSVQEDARQRLIRKVSETNVSDASLVEQFFEYCDKYDPELRLTRTEKVLRQILRERPNVQGLLCRKTAR